MSKNIQEISKRIRRQYVYNLIYYKKRRVLFMNSHQLIDNLIRGKKADRIGLYDSIWPETIKLWKSQGHFSKESENSESEDEIDGGTHFGFDMASIGGWFDCNPIKGYKEVVEETDEWHIIRNGAGASLKWWKNKSGTPEHIDFKMVSPEIWQKDYRQHLLSVDKERLNLKDTQTEMKKRQKQELFTFHNNLFIWEIMRQSLGDIVMMESLLLEPEWIHDYNRVYTDFFKNHYQVLIEDVGKPDGVWIYEDLGYKNGLFCSPSKLSELIFPYYKELVDFFHTYDIPVILHSCGNITEALPMIVQTGFDALNPMEVKAGCDVVKFAEKYGDKLAFIGGLDARVLESGDKDLIKREVTRIMKGMKDLGARYIFGSDHSLSPLVSYESFTCALDIYRENMLY